MDVQDKTDKKDGQQMRLVPRVYSAPAILIFERLKSRLEG
jgi:hypothetical protein